MENEIITLALISPYDNLDQDLFADSLSTLAVFDIPEDGRYEVVEVTSISSVVAMVPFDEGRVFAVHKMGLDICSMAGDAEADTEAEF